MAFAERISVILFRRVKITAHQFIASIDRNLSRRASLSPKKVKPLRGLHEGLD
ncbi:MAG: hypothetical protein FWC58_03900 [Desulfobulbus sp.]|nr:hypothetical protein [Desulfobulbus sp.]